VARGGGAAARGEGAEGRGGVDGRATGVGGLGTNFGFIARADLPDFFSICTETDKNNSIRTKKCTKTCNIGKQLVATKHPKNTFAAYFWEKSSTKNAMI